MEKKKRPILKKILRLLAWVFGILFLLILLITLLLRTPWAQRKIKDEAVKFLEKKIGTNVDIASIRINWLYNLEIEGVKLDDQDNEPLLYLGKLEASYRLMDLFSNQLTIHSVSIDSLYANARRPAGTDQYNFSYIINAFVDSTAEETPADTSSSSMKIDIGKITLNKVNLLFNDVPGGQYFAVKAASLETRLKTLDTEKQLYEVDYLETLALNGTIRFTESSLEEEVEATADSIQVEDGTLPEIHVNRILLKQTAFVFDDAPGGISTKTYAGWLQLDDSHVLLNENKMMARKLILNDHSTGVTIGSSNSRDPEEEPETDTSSAPFQFSIAGISLERNSIRYDDATAPQLKSQLDYGHLFLDDLVLKAENLSSDGLQYMASIKEFSAREQSGFLLRNLTGDIVYGEKEISWQKGELLTNRNTIHANLNIQYDSLAQLTTAPNRVMLNIALNNTSIVLDDFLYIMPDLASNEYIKPLLGKTFRLQTSIRGPMNDFRIPELRLREGRTNLMASARVSGIPDMEKMKIDLQLKEFRSTREGLLSWLPPDLLPSNIQLPENFTLSGTYNGSTEDMRTNLALRTSRGNIGIKGHLKNVSDTRSALYDLVLNTSETDLGYLLQDSTMGKASVDFTVKGRGLDPAVANADFSGKINSFGYNGYNYSKINLKGSLKNQLLEAQLNSEDPNLQTNIDLAYNLDSTNPSIKADVAAAFVDLKKLGFSTDDFTLKGNINADLTSADPNHPNGDVYIHNLQFGKNGELIPLDSITITARHSRDSQFIATTAPFMQISVAGQYGLSDLAAQTGDMIQRYLSDQPDTIPLPENPQQASISGIITYPKFITSFVPEWRSMTPLRFEGELNTGNAAIDFETSTRQLRYADFILDSMLIRIKGDKDSLTYAAGIRRLISPSLPLYKTDISGGISDNNISWAVATEGKSEEDRYRLAGYIQTQGTRNIIHLEPGILLNAVAWNVNGDNQVVLEDGGLAGGNLTLSNNGQSITVTTGGGGVPVEMNFDNFPIEALAGIIERDTAIAEGFINGSVVVPQLQPFEFTADLRIDSLKGMGYPVGKLTAKVNSTEAGIYNVDANLSDNGNDVNIEGTYNGNDSGSMNFTVALDPINIASIQPAANAILDSLKGTISGQLRLSGTPSSPAIRGSIRTRNAELIYKEYSTFVRMPNEEIVFDDQGVLLNEFVLADSAGNEAVITGRVRTTDYSSFGFDLQLDANNFRVVNQRLSPEQWIYGPAAVNADISVKGDMDLPVIEGEVSLVDDSQLTIVLQEEDPGLESRQGIVKFVNKNTPLDSTLIEGQIDADTVQIEEITAMDLSVNVEISPASTLTIVLDEMNGDQLQVKGTATLNATIDPSGKTSMTGRYEVNEGKYQLSLSQLIKRDFDIVKGGTIIWNGDPTSATLDLSAVYRTNTVAYTLIQDVVSSNNTAATRQKIPFEVYLNIDGEMLEPEISFRIDMAERDQNVFGGVVYTRIKQINQDPSELNKQVMGLLVLNNFIADDPFSSLQGNFSDDLESTARRTAGKILSQQLNNLLGDLIEGVDLNFDLESQDDFSSGSKDTQTDLNVSASKNLFNDRTTVTIGSSVGLEGSQNATAIAGDISIEYKLSKDGRYRVKLYRVNNDQAVIQGQFIETGVSFILFMDYNRFKELFQKKKEKQVTRRRENNEAPQ